MLQAPPYIVKSGVSGSPIKYSWQPYKAVAITKKYSKNIDRLVDDLSLRASLTLGIGIGEWLRWRLEGIASYAPVNQFIEAAWARTIDRHYLKISEPKPPKDSGDPGSGPLFALQYQLFSVVMRVTYEHPERAATVAQIAALVRYTLTDPTPFDEWLKTTLKRFGANFAMDPDSRGGPFVPRTFLDPAVLIRSADVPRLLDEQLQSIDYEGNPFLATPAEMRKAGFEGTPYRYQS